MFLGCPKIAALNAFLILSLSTKENNTPNEVSQSVNTMHLLRHFRAHRLWTTEISQIQEVG